MKPVVMFISSLDSCLPKWQVILRAWKILPGTKIETYCSLQQLRTVASLRQKKGALHHVRSLHRLSCHGRDSRVTLVSTDLAGDDQGKQDPFFNRTHECDFIHVCLWLPGDVDFSPALTLWYLPSFKKARAPTLESQASTFLL